MFGSASSRWIKFSEYDAKQADSSDWYNLPCTNATPDVYDPIENVEIMVVDALNIGLNPHQRISEKIFRIKNLSNL